MGLFFNYSKPGPGVDKNAPKKKGVFLYFEIFGRKVWKLIELNFMYVLFSLPAVLIYYFLTAPTAVNFIQSIAKDPGFSQESVEIYSASFALFFTMIFVTLLGSGPASASMAFMMRSFSREEHVWLGSDFIKKMKENFKQGIIVSIIDIFMVTLGFNAIFIYNNLFIQKGENIWFVLMWILCIFMMMYFCMHYYIYQLMVTFENKTKDLYKNAAILTISTLPQCLLLTVLAVVVEFFIYNIFNPVLSIILSLIFIITFLRFPIEFYCASVIKKKVLDNIPTETEEVKGSDN